MHDETNDILFLIDTSAEILVLSAQEGERGEIFNFCRYSFGGTLVIDFHSNHQNYGTSVIAVRIG